MSDTSGIINRVRFDSAVATNSADVVVKGFSNNALQGILEAISKTNSVLNDLQSGLDDIQSGNDKRAQADEKRNKNEEKNRVASLASERRSRATNAAIYGEIKKGNIFNKMLREGLTQALDGLTSFLKDNLKQSLKSMQDLSAIMRKANLSKADKDAIQLKAGSAITDVSTYFNNLQVDRDEVNSFLGDLVADGKDITALTAEQTASYIALRKSGLAADKAYVAAMTTSAKDLEKPINSLRMPGVAQAMNATMETVTSAQIAAMGGWSKAINSISENSRQYVETLGMSGVATGDAADMVAGYTMAQHGLYDQMSDQQKNVAVFYKNNMTDTANALKDASETLKLGARTGVFSDSYANIAMMQEAGTDTGMERYTDGEVGESNKVNTDKGMARVWFDKLVAGFDDVTGGMVSGLTNRLDELFGDNADIAGITSTGFKIVAGLLGSLLLANSGLGGIIIAGISPLLSGISTLFSGGSILSLISGALKGLGSFLLKGIVSIISKIPALAAIGAGVAGIYAAYESATDTADRWSNLENAEKDLKDVRAQQAELESRLLIAQKSNDADAVAKYSTALAEANKRVSEAEKNYQEADNKRTAAHETSVNFEKGIRDKNKSLMDERAELRKLQQQAFATGDIKLSEKFKKQADDLNEEINRNNEKIRTVSKESESFLTTGIASLTRAFGYEFSAENMMAWSNFKSGVGEFFTKDIPEFFTKIIPNAFSSAGNFVWDKISSAGNFVWDNISSAGNFVWDKISSFGKSAYGLFNEYLVNPIRGFFSEFGTSISENFINPIRGFFSSINSFIDENFMQPLKSFFDFKWLPEPVYKFIFDENYGAADMALDLSSAALNNVKEFLDGAASTISEGINFVQGLWKFSDGGVVNQATPAVVGEDGKEAILPLEKPDQLLSVLNKLTASERSNILKSILSSNDFSLDNLSNTLIKISNDDTQFSAANSSLMSSKSALSDDSSTMNSIQRYIISEFPSVVNQATPAVVIKDRSGNTQSVENIQVTHEAWVPAIYGSFIDSIFKSDGLLTSESRLVSLNNFISKFIDEDQATTAEQIESNSLAREYIEAVKAVRSSSSNEAKQVAAQFSKTALILLGNKSSSPEILAALNAMIRYLRDIASSPANKKVISSVSRPISTSY